MCSDSSTNTRKIKKNHFFLGVGGYSVKKIFTHVVAEMFKGNKGNRAIADLREEDCTSPSSLTFCVTKG